MVVRRTPEWSSSVQVSRDAVGSFGFVFLATFLVIAVGLAGCGYYSVSSYLDYIDSIRIPPVRNQTAVFELEDELTSELQRRFQVKWNVGDDATLLVSVFDYEIKPLRYDVNNLPEQYRMTLRLSYEFEDNVKHKLIASSDDYEFHRDFYVVSGRGQDPEDEPTARKRLITDLAENLYNNLAEQW